MHPPSAQPRRPIPPGSSSTGNGSPARRSPALPPADPAAVLRVITARASLTAPVSVQQAWLEAPLCGKPQSSGPVAFLHLDGRCLPMLGDPLTPEQQAALEHWQQLLRGGCPSCIAACLE
ncbi:MAG: hypothetical protein ACKO1V_00365, partial [Cyanobium sp.]